MCWLLLIPTKQNGLGAISRRPFGGPDKEIITTQINVLYLIRQGNELMDDPFNS